MMTDGYCVVLPTYNNEGTLSSVIESVLSLGYPLIVVADGCTDGSASVLERFEGRIAVVSYPDNRGKGHALVQGFRKALSMGFTHAVTIDSDGQHSAGDIESLVSVSRTHPSSLIIGSRCLTAENMPSGNTFANRFGNFWFAVQTLRVLPDTQSGFRVYPLQVFGRMNVVTTRYEAELEMLVRACWRGMDIRPVGVSVLYPEDRVTHFRPGRDFLRISLLNTVLTLAAVPYGYPSMLWHRLFG